MSTSLKKRQRIEAISSEEQDTEPTTTTKKTCPDGCDAKVGDEAKPWRLPAAALNDAGNKFVLCHAEDMPQPADGFILLNWIQQCATSSYPNSHRRFMIPSGVISKDDWQSLVKANNVISDPLEPLDEYSSSDRKILRPLISHSSSNGDGPFVPSFMKKMKVYEIPYCAIVDATQVRQYILTGCIEE